jgi:hypothetical protein
MSSDAHSSTKLDLLNDTLAIAPENYKDNVRIIASLDDKAQKMGAIAGIFLGVLLAIVKPDQLPNLLGAIGRRGTWVATLATVLLMICVGVCLWCIWTQEIAPPLSLGHMNQISRDIHKGKDLEAKTQELYYSERIAVWSSCIDNQGEVIKKKQARVSWAQSILASAMLVFAFMLLFLVHSVKATSPSASFSATQQAAPAAPTK